MKVCMEFLISLQVYCYMVSVDQVWTLLAPFSNSDTKNWMDDSGDWWYVLKLQEKPLTRRITQT